jgi:hypothetical protein
MRAPSMTTNKARRVKRLKGKHGEKQQGSSIALPLTPRSAYNLLFI